LIELVGGRNVKQQGKWEDLAQGWRVQGAQIGSEGRLVIGMQGSWVVDDGCDDERELLKAKE
jgi:hypothetical protein